MEKVCFKCGVSKPLSEYYKHAQMGDGHLNKCKSCTRHDSEQNRQRKLEDPEWVKREAERQRIKQKKSYHTQLKGNSKYNERINKSRKRWEMVNPEKRKAQLAASTIECPIGFNRHHWSYIQDNWRDVIIISVSNHFYIHRFLEYVPELMCFKSPEGLILDTKEKHLKYINSLLLDFNGDCVN